MKLSNFLIFLLYHIFELNLCLLNLAVMLNFLFPILEIQVLNLFTLQFEHFENWGYAIVSLFIASGVFYLASLTFDGSFWTNLTMLFLKFPIKSYKALFAFNFYLRTDIFMSSYFFSFEILLALIAIFIFIRTISHVSVHIFTFHFLLAF